MKKNIFWATAAAVILTFAGISSCKTPTQVDSSYAYASFKTSCLGSELDGSMLLRTWGKGTNKAAAIEQARKNAIRDVVFKGIQDGSSDCNKRPLITEVNAEEKYEYYFNQFFAEGGAYQKYVVADEKKTSRITAKAKSLEQWSVVVSLNRTALRQRLIEDEIIKP